MVLSKETSFVDGVIDAGMEERRDEFFQDLFDAFEEERAKLREIEDPEERFEMLERYVTLYHKIVKAAKEGIPEVSRTEIVVSTLRILVDHAEKMDRGDVKQFMAENFDAVKSLFFKRQSYR